MSNSVLIIGESGSGKSSGIRSLDPEETFIINVLDKPLPFKGFRKSYKTCDKENPTGNYICTDNPQTIVSLVKAISDKRNEIKNIILDDWQYTMANAFMRRALEKGYDKFSELAKNSWEIINALNNVRTNLTCFVLTHSDVDIHGKSKCKTIGKMLEDKICIEGMFTVVLHSLIIDGKYVFLTQNDGIHLAKSPMGMFSDKLIDNDLQFVATKINEYFYNEFECDGN